MFYILYASHTCILDMIRPEIYGELETSSFLLKKKYALTLDWFIIRTTAKYNKFYKENLVNCNINLKVLTRLAIEFFILMTDMLFTMDSPHPKLNVPKYDQNEYLAMPIVLRNVKLFFSWLPWKSELTEMCN